MHVGASRIACIRARLLMMAAFTTASGGRGGAERTV